MKIFFLLIIFISCATSKKSTDLDTVTFSNTHDDKLAISEDSMEVIPIQVDTSDKLGDEVGREKKAVISLSFYSSLYSSLALVNFFKLIEQEEIDISVINANGFAAVVCALYAKEKNSNTLEWKLFALLKQLKGLRPYGKEWREVIAEFITKEFAKTELSELKISLQIPTIINNDIVMLKDSKVREVLLKNLDLENKTNYFKRPVLYKRNLVENRSDLNFNFVFIPSNIKFKLIDGYSWGIFTNYFGFILKNEQNINQIKTQQDIFIDDLAPLSDINGAYQAEAQQSIEKIQNEIKLWREEISSSSN